MLNVWNEILNKTDHEFEFIDLGGGMGITYSDKNKKERKYKLELD